MTTAAQDPAETLTGCTVLQSATIFYPLNEVPDLERSGRRAIRPRQVKIHVTRTNGGPWELSLPVVIGREVLKNGALGSTDRAQVIVFDQPQWLAEVMEHVEARLNVLEF